MDNIINHNYAEISGTLAELPRFSHENRGEKFYVMPVAVRRLSGTLDTINVIAREKLLMTLALTEGIRVHIFGQLRSFNNKSDTGAKLIISLFARDIVVEPCEDRNDILLHGTICKAQNLRTTPLGREICDFMLAVNRRYGRSDYLPCIAWGKQARQIAQLPVGTVLTLSGRIQSRQYIKIIQDRPIEKTAYEVSIIEYEIEKIPET